MTRRKKRSSSSKTISSPLLWLGLLGVGGFALFKSRSAAAAKPTASANPQLTAPITTVGPVSLLPIQAGTQNIPELPATMAPTQQEVANSGSFWDNLQPVQGLSSGYINFPSGAQSAAALFPTRMDANGQYYVQWAGLVYVLGSQDSSGNWTAQAVG